MRQGPAILAATLLAVAACGGNVIVDGAGTTTGTATSTGSTSTGSASGGTTSGCQTTCLEVLKEGGGICNDMSTAGVDLLAVVTCADQSCGSQCANITTTPADAACFDCLASSCAFPLMACTGN